MKVGFIGLGHLGGAMAVRLKKTDTDLMVWNRTEEKALGLKVPVADTPSDLISRCDLVFINVTDSKAVEDILYSKDGMANGDIKGKVIVDTTTNHFDSVVMFHKDISKKGATYLEAPVIGSVRPAEEGRLLMLVSGDKSVFDRCKIQFQKLASTIVFMGSPGRATKMKLINNYVLASFMAALAQAIRLGESAGIRKNDVISLLEYGAGKSMVLSAKKDKLLSEDYSPHFTVANLLKDLNYAEDLAKKSGIELVPDFKALYASVDKDKDFSAVYQALGA